MQVTDGIVIAGFEKDKKSFFAPKSWFKSVGRTSVFLNDLIKQKILKYWYRNLHYSNRSKSYEA